MSKTKIGQLNSILNQEFGVHGNNYRTVIDLTLFLYEFRTANFKDSACDEDGRKLKFLEPRITNFENKKFTLDVAM